MLRRCVPITEWCCRMLMAPRHYHWRVDLAMWTAAGCCWAMALHALCQTCRVTRRCTTPRCAVSCTGLPVWDLAAEGRKFRWSWLSFVIAGSVGPLEREGAHHHRGEGGMRYSSIPSVLACYCARLALLSGSCDTNLPFNSCGTCASSSRKWSCFGITYVASV